MSSSLNLHFEGGPHAEDIDIKLFDILLSYLPADSKTSAEQVASSINDLSPASAPDDAETDQLAGFVSRFWSLMLTSVEQIDYDTVPMQRFILLIKALRDLPSQKVLHPQHGSDYRQKVWQDLPFMQSELQDRWRRKFPTSPGDIHFQCKLTP
jgi:hypothetical protein